MQIDKCNSCAVHLLDQSSHPIITRLRRRSACWLLLRIASLIPTSFGRPRRIKELASRQREQLCRMAHLDDAVLPGAVEKHAACDSAPGATDALHGKLNLQSVAYFKLAYLRHSASYGFRPRIPGCHATPTQQVTAAIYSMYS